MFRSARLKLTAWYLLIITFISMSFSLVLYRVVTGEFERFERMQRFRIERRFNTQNLPPNFMHRFPLPVDPELIREIKQRLAFMLMLINGGIFLVAGGLGFFLAGRTLAPIKDMVDEQSRFISDASHELRTPLTSLKTAMEVTLRDKKLSIVQAKKLISENINDVNKLQSLSDQLLRLAQYEKPNGNLPLEKISLTKVIKEAVRKINPLAKQKQISVICNLKNVEIKGNKESLVDLLVILLDNAVKYSPEAEMIEIAVVKKDGITEISVKDRGIGISKKDLPHVFDRFYRGDLSRSKSGYGLGLSIAKKIVDIHKGKIKVKSNINQGSAFFVQLPVYKV